MKSAIVFAAIVVLCLAGPGVFLWRRIKRQRKAAGIAHGGVGNVMPEGWQKNLNRSEDNGSSGDFGGAGGGD